MKITKKLNISKLLPLLLVLIGNIAFAFSVKLFILPAKLISCGTTGIGMVVEHMTDIPMSTFILVFNLVMLTLGWIVLGKKFAMTTIFSSMFVTDSVVSVNSRQATCKRYFRTYSLGVICITA